MMPLSYIDSPAFHQHTLSGLIHSLLDPQDPTPAIRRTFHLASLLLLSNHIDHAHSLICALYRHVDTILPPSSRSTYIPNAFLALNYFWQTHPTHPRPANANAYASPAAALAREQWAHYRECTRTGWMLEHCGLHEPDDTHVWRERDDALMLAMCARLLAKSTTEGVYPSEERMREALAAARKLYAQPQVPITEWNAATTVRRHAYLLYRRLVVELAIRVGDLETAAEVLGLGLRLDGFDVYNGGQLERYLFLPGIYDVLPVLAEQGKASNPFYIEADDAVAMVRALTEALKLRACKGRQWSLAPEKVGWPELLDRLAKGAWEVNSREYKARGVKSAMNILYPPTSEDEITAAEMRVGELPADFKAMVRVANGFKGGGHFLGGGISGIRNLSISDEDIDFYVSNLGEQEMAQRDGSSAHMIQLLPGAACDGFRHFIITPAGCASVGIVVKDGEYRYWHEAPWQGGGDVWKSVRDWVASCVEDVEAMVEKGEKKDNGDVDSDSENDEGSESFEEEDQEYE